jgi:prolipoprotein diacylglyceryltransferase
MFIVHHTLIGHMAEAGMAAYGAVIGVWIALAVILFSLRGKGHPEPIE